MTVSGVGRGYADRSVTPRRTEAMNKNDFSQKLSAAEKQMKADEKNDPLTTEEMMQKIREKMAEIYDKVKKGKTEQSFQIGGVSLTIKEWNRLLERFDETEEDVRKLLAEAREQQKKNSAAKEENDKNKKSV